MGELIVFWSYRKIGGMTGDVYGAVIELCEVASLIIFWGVTIWI
jgi:adenosylcobinamide-GDP ribazoletransferase